MIVGKIPVMALYAGARSDGGAAGNGSVAPSPRAAAGHAMGTLLWFVAGVACLVGCEATRSAAGSCTAPAAGWKAVIDFFSGRPNPELPLGEEDTRALAQELSRLCADGQSVPVAQAEYPSRLGYRGIQIHQLGPQEGTAPPLTLFDDVMSVGDPIGQSCCRERVQAAGGTLVLRQNNRSAERLIVNLAYQRGVLSENLHRELLAELAK